MTVMDKSWVLPSEGSVSKTSQGLLPLYTTTESFTKMASPVKGGL